MQLDLTPSTKPGTGNGIYLADLAEGTPDKTLDANERRGKYPELCQRFKAGWRRMNGRRA